jgi:site-specific recombinase XerD
MDITDSILNYRRFLKRKNYSPRTVRNYMSNLKHFAIWLPAPIESASNGHVLRFVDFLRARRLKPKTVNCYLQSIRGFYDWLRDEQPCDIANPVKRGYALKESKPLPKYLRDGEVEKLFGAISKPRDLAIFKLMLRCGLRVEEAANLTLDAVYLKRRCVHVENGKGGKGRVVFMSGDACAAMVAYLEKRPASRARRIFLVEKGPCRGRPLSVRGIQKRMEHYSKKAGLKISCHQPRHTMATQLLNADMDLVSIQDLPGHSRIKTTERYTKVSNAKVMRDYFKAMESVLRDDGGQRRLRGPPSPKPQGFIALGPKQRI